MDCRLKEHKSNLFDMKQVDNTIMLKEISAKLKDLNFVESIIDRKKINNEILKLESDYVKKIEMSNSVIKTVIEDYINKYFENLRNNIGDIEFYNFHECLTITYFSSTNRWLIETMDKIESENKYNLKEMANFSKEELSRNTEVFISRKICNLSTKRFYFYLIKKDMEIGRLILMPTSISYN